MEIIIAISLWGIVTMGTQYYHGWKSMGIARLHPLSLLPSWSILSSPPTTPLTESVQTPITQHLPLPTFGAALHWTLIVFLSLSFSRLFWNSSLSCCSPVFVFACSQFPKKLVTDLVYSVPAGDTAIYLLDPPTFLPAPPKGSGELRTPSSIQKIDQMGFSPKVRSIWKWATLERCLEAFNHYRISIQWERFSCQFNFVILFCIHFWKLC